MDSLYDTLSSGLSYVGDAVEKPGRAVRGVLAGKPREAMAAIPFSDSMGLTDHKDRTSGRDLLDSYGMTTKGSSSFGAKAAGFGVDMVTDPLNLIAGAGAYRAAPTAMKGLKAGAKALTGLDLVDSIGRGGMSLAGGAKSLLKGEAGGVKVPRWEPDFVNGKDFYHGTGTPHLTAGNLDPNRTKADGLFGPGVYTTDAPKIAQSYAGLDHAGSTPTIYRGRSSFNKILDLDQPATPDFREAIHATAQSLHPDVRRALDDPAWSHQWLEQPKATGADLYGRLHGGIMTHASEIAAAQETAVIDAMRGLVGPARADAMKAYNARRFDTTEAYEPLRGLADTIRSQGVDALTHTGGLRAGLGTPAGRHQVVVGLDPNNVRGAAPATPYKVWELMKKLGQGEEGALSFGSFGALSNKTSKGVPRPPREPDLLDLEDFYSAPKNRPAAPPGAGQSTLNRVHKLWTPTPESEAITTPSIVAAWRANREGLATVENFPTEWTLKNYDPRVLAHYNPLEHEIGLNMGYRHAPNGASIWQDQAAMQDAMNSMKSSGHMASNSVTHIIDHEIGHGMHRDSLGVGPFMHLHQFGALTPGQLDASRNVSGYAGTNALEAVAETYAGLRNGRLFRGTPAVGKLFKEFAGNPMLEKLGNEGLLKGLGLGVGGLAAGYGLSQASPATSGNYQRSAL